MLDLESDQLIQIAKSFPALESIIFAKSMSGIRNNLKLLDKLSRNAEHITSLSSSKNFGESHLIDFVWSEEFENKPDGLQISRFLKELAEFQADHLTIGIKTKDLSVEKLLSADTLKNRGVLKLSNERIYFTHDLYSEWARYKQIKSHVDELGNFLIQKDLSSPLWAKSVRLFGVSLLEQDPTGQTWKFQFEQTREKQQLLFQDLILESFFFAPDSLSLLTAHKKLLFESEGILIKKIMQLFFLRATSADDNTLKVAGELGISKMIATSFNRIPIYTYWPDFLQFLWSEWEQVLHFDIVQVSKIASCWLEKTIAGFPFRQEASSLCLKAAANITALRESGRYLDDKVTRPIYQGLLLGFRENPTAAKELCLRLCKRTSTKTEKAKQNKSTAEIVVTGLGGRGFILSPKEPWPLGPLERVDQDFRNTCLESFNMVPVFYSDQLLAKEILLAVLIEEPDDDWGSASSYKDNFQIVDENGWYPPFYLRGPFLNFLRIAPLIALEFIIDLTNFATEQWRKNHTEEFDGYEIKFDSKLKKYLEDYNVLGWSSDIGNAPDTLVSVLMALEQFFYEEIEKNNNVDAYIDYLIANASSLSLIGVLINIGKFHPLFLTGKLKALLSIYEILEWDIHAGYRDFVRISDYPRGWDAQVKQWKDRPHRKYVLRDLLIHFIVTNKEFDDHFQKTRINWNEQLQRIQAARQRDVFLYQLIHFTNSKNYIKETVDEGTYMKYIEPAEATEYLAEGRAATLENFQDGQFAYKMHMLIDKQLPFEMNDVDYLWNRLQKDFSEIDQYSTDHCSGEHAWASPYTNLLAAIKILLHHKQLWHSIHPEYLEWIKGFCVDLISKQFAWQGHFSSVGTDEDWNISLSKIVPDIWKEDTKDEVIRKVVAGVILLFNNKTVLHFFVTASKIFEWNDPDFVQVQNLLLEYSAEEYRIPKDFNSNFAETSKLKIKLSKKFAEGFISDNIIDWSTIRSAEEWKSKETNGWRENKEDLVRKKGISTHFLHPLIEAIPNIKDVDNDSKSYLISFLNQAFDQVIYQLGNITEESKAIRYWNNDFSRAVLGKIAKGILYVEDVESRSKLWKPLFAFGYIAPDAIATFCNSFFVNLDASNVYPRMVEVLNEMVEFTYAENTWKTKFIDRHQDFRICIMGFHSWMVDVWKYDYSEFTSLAKEIYKKWFSKNTYNPHVLDALLSFITTPSGKFMLQSGLYVACLKFNLSLKMSEEKAPEGKVWVGNPELDHKLAMTLSDLWQHHNSDVKNDSITYKLFRMLIEYLIAIKNVVGIELQSALIIE